MVFVIGIAGCSCSGKSQCSLLVQQHFGNDRVQIVHQDDFFLPAAQIPVNNQGLQDWDCLEAIDMDRFTAEVKHHIVNTTKDIVIVEGFLLFATEHLMDMFDKRYLLHVDLEDLLERRRNRVYPVDDAEYWQDPPGYIETVVYPNYIKYYQQHLSNSTEMQILNSSELRCDELTKRIIHDIKKLI